MSDSAPHGFALFDTAIGRCGVAWSERGIAGIALPGPSDAQTRQRLSSVWRDRAQAEPGAPAVPPPNIAAAIALIVQHVAGTPAPLEDIVLDMTGVTEFHQRIYALARAIPAGRTATYGELAKALGQPGAARAIGQAMGKNPFPIVVPCHRVLAANRATGGFSAYGGVETKAKLLAAEGYSLGLQVQLPIDR